MQVKSFSPCLRPALPDWSCGRDSTPLTSTRHALIGLYVRQCCQNVSSMYRSSRSSLDLPSTRVIIYLEMVQPLSQASRRMKFSTNCEPFEMSRTPASNIPYATRNTGLEFFTCLLAYFWNAYNIERKKTVVDISRRAAASRCLIHFLPIAVSMALLQLNVGGFYMGEQLPPSSDEQGDNVILAFVQVAAKTQASFVSILVA